MTSTTEAEEVVGALRRFISRGEYGLNGVPRLVKEVIREGYWRQRPVEFKRFEEFVVHPPMEGLGADMDTIKRLCGNDPDALSLIDKEAQRGPGRPPKNGNNVTNKTHRPEGNKREKALRRLRDKRPDLHARVLDPDDKLTPHGAMVEAGFRHQPVSFAPNPKAADKAIRARFTAEQIAELVRLLKESER